MPRFLFENHTNGDLILPRPTHKGIRIVPPKQRFEGDEYYLPLRDVRLIEILSENSEDTMDKLITEQPPLVTNEGTVEFVKQGDGVSQFNETTPHNEDMPEVLLNESPLDGIEIV